MNKTVNLILALMCGLFITVANNANAQVSESELAAIDVVNSYFSALQQGDVTTIKSILTGKLLSQTEAYLNQSSYSNQLVNKFSGSSLNINNSANININTVIVKTTIQISADEQLKVSYKLEKISPSGLYLISAESDW